MKTYIITGAGTGIGQATAIELDQQRDARLVLIGRRKEKLEQTLGLLNKDKGHEVYSVDVSQKTSVAQCFELIGRTHKNVVGLFANAGIGGTNEYGDEDRWDEIMNINVNGSYYCIMEASKLMKISRETYRHIVITSSCLARFSVPSHSAYITSKTALLGLTKALAIDLGKDNILINSICPGWVETAMSKESIQNLADMQNITYQESHDQQTSILPLKKMSVPKEIAKLVSFLFSGDQNSMTGQGIDINNGSFMI